MSVPKENAPQPEWEASLLSQSTPAVLVVGGDRAGFKSPHRSTTAVVGAQWGTDTACQIQNRSGRGWRNCGENNGIKSKGAKIIGVHLRKNHEVDDAIWYGDYSRGQLGRYDPKTGDAREWASPGGPRSLPYGITYLDGAVWYSEAGVKPNTLVRFDIETEKFQTWGIPSGGGVVRNMMPTRDGGLALAESGVNRVALVDIKRN